ncbi:MAG: hypothetical protein V8R01_06360 [Bacilli bacterium]
MVRVKVKEKFSDKNDGYQIRNIGIFMTWYQERANELIANGKAEIYKESKKNKNEK